MKSLILSWLSTVLALATLMLLPNVTVTAPVLILISATLIWIVLILCWPFLKLFLLPFNLATFGFAGSVAYFLLFWLCLWIFPGVTIQPVRVFGLYLGDIAVLFAASLFLSLLHRGYLWLLGLFFHKKRRK
jgi:uncharacterized membrane protein YvlD (DUF360 family)